jgi:cytoskeletal protein CcmA (bactofilin family)
MSATDHPMPDANRLYIGEGVTIRGEIHVPDTLVVCGTLEGDVSVGNLVVGETGQLKGRITVAENAEISGTVFEKLDVKCLLVLRSTGRVDGNISYGLLQIEQGASIAGGLSSTEARAGKKADVGSKDQKAQPQPHAAAPAAAAGVRAAPKQPDVSPATPPKPATATPTP